MLSLVRLNHAASSSSTQHAPVGGHHPLTRVFPAHLWCYYPKPTILIPSSAYGLNSYSTNVDHPLHDALAHLDVQLIQEIIDFKCYLINQSRQAPFNAFPFSSSIIQYPECNNNN